MRPLYEADTQCDCIIKGNKTHAAHDKSSFILHLAGENCFSQNTTLNRPTTEPDKQAALFIDLR